MTWLMAIGAPGRPSRGGGCQCCWRTLMVGLWGPKKEGQDAFRHREAKQRGPNAYANGPKRPDTGFFVLKKGVHKAQVLLPFFCIGSSFQFLAS